MRAEGQSQGILLWILGSVRSCSRRPRPDPAGKEDNEVVHAVQMVDAKRRSIPGVRRSIYSEEGDRKENGWEAARKEEVAYARDCLPSPQRRGLWADRRPRALELCTIWEDGLHTSANVSM